MDVRSVGLSLWPKPPTYQCKTQAILNVFVLIFLNTLNYLKRQVTKKHIETWKSLFWDMQCMKTTAYVYNIALNIPSPTEEELVCSLCWPGRKYRSPKERPRLRGGQTSARPRPVLCHRSLRSTISREYSSETKQKICEGFSKLLKGHTLLV